MCNYSNVTDQALNKLRNLSEQQKNQRALRTKNRILKQTHDIKYAESLSTITKKLDAINGSTKQFRGIVEKSDVENGNTQTPAIENITGTKSLRDTLSFMKEIKNFFQFRRKR